LEDIVVARRPVATRVLMPFTAGLLAGGLHHPGAPGALLTATIVLAGVRAATPVAVRATLAAAAAGLAVGALLTVVARLPLPADHVARHTGASVAAVEGTILQRGQTGTRLSGVVDVDRVRTGGRDEPASGLVAVTIAHASHRSERWDVGRRVRLVGRLRRPRNFANPGAYDQVGSLARRGIHATMFFWDDQHINLLDDPETSISHVVAHWRRALAARIAARTPEPARGYLTAVLLGEARSLDARTRAALTRTGLAHVVSVSGFHVAVTAGACFVLLRWLLLRSERVALRFDVDTLASVLGAVPVAAYAAIAGGSVPATRSFLAYGVVVGALGCERPTDGLRALALAAALIGLTTPAVAADVSFELSFVSVLALILLGRRQRRRSPPSPTLVRWAHRLVVAPVAVSMAATLATAPLTAWHFQQVSLIAPVANVVCLPLLGPATLLPGLAALALTPLAPPLAAALLDVAARAATAGLALATKLAEPTWAALFTPMPSLLELGLAYAALALWSFRPAAPRGAMRRRWCILLVLVVAAAGADATYWWWERFADPTLRVTFLSVGQGDAAVVEVPRGGVLVVDGGGVPGDFDPGERVIAPFLRARKILHVDVLALSHPQLDHYGGLAYLAEHFAPQEIWSNGMRSTAAAFLRLEGALAAAGTRVRVLHRGMRLPLAPGVVAEILHPDHLDGLGINDASLVLRLRFRRTAVLFTGDIEHAAERMLLADPERLRSTVLKVPHHGSATSSAAYWLAAVAPRIAVISSGADNRFGFPAPAVVHRLHALGATVRNTADTGAIRVVSDGRDVHIEEQFEFPQLLW
jgi:competence protein ComEC